MLVTVLHWGRRSKLCWGQCINGCALVGVDLVGFVSIIGDPHSDFPLAGFVLLGWAEGRFIKIELLLQIMQLLQIDKSRNIL